MSCESGGINNVFLDCLSFFCLNKCLIDVFDFLKGKGWVFDRILKLWFEDPKTVG